MYREAVHAAKISEDVPANNESALLKAVAMQSVSVAVDVSEFQFLLERCFSWKLWYLIRPWGYSSWIHNQC